MTTIAGPAAAIGTAPYLIGFTPTDSAVILAMKESRLTVTARLDLADTDTTTLQTLAGRLAAHGATDCIVIVYGATLAAAGVDADHIRADLGPWLRVRDALAVAGDRWRSTMADHPAMGYGVPPTPSAACDLAVAGAAPLPDRDALVHELDPAPVADPLPLAGILASIPDRDEWVKESTRTAAQARAAYDDAAAAARSLNLTHPKRAHALAVAALLALCAGDGARANLAAERCRRESLPVPTLLDLVDTMLAHLIEPATIRAMIQKG